MLGPAHGTSLGEVQLGAKPSIVKLGSDTLSEVLGF